MPGLACDSPKVLDGLEDWLTQLGLQDHLSAAIRWCDEMGACHIEEVVDSVEEFGEALDLKPEELKHLVDHGFDKMVAVHAPAAKAMGALPSVLPAPSAAVGEGSPETLSAGQRINLRTISTNVGGEVMSGASRCSFQRILTIQSAVKSFKSQLSGKSPASLASPVSGGKACVDFGIDRTCTVTCSGPMSGLIATMPIKDKTFSIREMPRDQAHRDAGSKFLKRYDTVGVEVPERAQTKRELLVSTVKTPTAHPVSIDDGQTGTVYAVEIGGEKVAVFKPSEGEKFSRKSLDVGKGSIREEAAYLVDRFSGSSAMVPVTSRAKIEVDGKDVEGSVQAFVCEVLGPIEDFGMPRDLEKACEFIPQETAEAVAMLDMRVFNMDRHSGNLLLLNREKPHGLGPIDHGCCFPPWWSLSEAIFDAWVEWPQLKGAPSEASRELARTAYGKLADTCLKLNEIGLDEASIVTLRVCTILIYLGVGKCGLSCHSLAQLLLRDEDAGFAEFSWLETQVLLYAGQAGAKCEAGVNDRGEQEMIVQDNGAGLDTDDFLDRLKVAFEGKFNEMMPPVASVRY